MLESGPDRGQAALPEAQPHGSARRFSGNTDRPWRRHLKAAYPAGGLPDWWRCAGDGGAGWWPCAVDRCVRLVVVPGPWLCRGRWRCPGWRRGRTAARAGWLRCCVRSISRCTTFRRPIQPEFRWRTPVIGWPTARVAAWGWRPVACVAGCAAVSRELARRGEPVTPLGCRPLRAVVASGGSAGGCHPGFGRAAVGTGGENVASLEVERPSRS